MSEQEKCPACGATEAEEWWGCDGRTGSIYGANLSDGVLTVESQPQTCEVFNRKLLADIAAIENVDQLRDCIIRYCDPNPTGGILHLVLEEGGYEDRTIRFCLDFDREDTRNDPTGHALGEALLKFTPAERAYANRWETAA
jgi:hypothetical protein